jgi:hypothetical protein
LASACRDTSTTSNPPQTDLSGKLSAALAMDKGTPRHNTLCQIAIEAASAGEAVLVSKAIAEIDPDSRNNLLSTCSKALAKRGNTSDAVSLAKQITNDTSRNNLLAQIASGRIE